jgi:hypothetical protein
MAIGHGGGRYGTLTVQPRAVHNMFMSLARVAPQSKMCHDLLSMSERLEAQGLATDGMALLLPKAPHT